MSKTRRAHKKFFDDDFDYDDSYYSKKDKKFRDIDRRMKKRVKNALKTKDIDQYYEWDQDEYD